MLRCLREGRPIALPRFDKAKDERRPAAELPPWQGRCDLVIFEGWCMGARPQRANELEAPVNDLERIEDPTGDWRWYVNRERGGHYQTLFAELDLLLMLCPPDFDRVYGLLDEPIESAGEVPFLTLRGRRGGSAIAAAALKAMARG